MRSTDPRLLALVLVLTAGCGGGAGDAAKAVDGLTPNPGPQIALLLSNGHAGLGPANYLDDATGPALEAALIGAGYSVQVDYFVDAPNGDTTAGGYPAFVARLVEIRDLWIHGRLDPTRVVVVGHSHGCVRSHAAIRAVADCPIRLLVDLDGSSLGWSITHGNEDIGGVPQAALAIAGTNVCADHPSVPSAPSPFDLEDVVFDNVQEAYEVRSGDPLIEYDQAWNVRLDGTTTGLTCVFSATNHGEVVLVGGATMTGVEAWILARLASD